jgi:hypothetical protein
MPARCRWEELEKAHPGAPRRCRSSFLEAITWVDVDATLNPRDVI